MGRNIYKMHRYLTEHNYCERCHTSKSTCVHHILPVVMGGKEQEDNYMSLCDTCHSIIHRETEYSRSFLTKEGIQKAGQKPIEKVLIDKIDLLQRIHDEEPTTAHEVIDIILESRTCKTVREK